MLHEKERGQELKRLLKGRTWRYPLGCTSSANGKSAKRWCEIIRENL